MKFFSIDSPFSRALSFIGDLMILNILFLLCCIPVVTIGASASALYTVTMRMAAKDDRGIVKPFLKAFRENLGKSVVLWLVFLVFGAVIALGISVMYLNPGRFPWFLKALYGLIVFVYLTGLSWVFPLQAKFENTIGNTLKNSFIIGIACPGKTVLLIILMLIPFLMAFFFTYYFIAFGFIWLLFGFSGIAFVQSIELNKGLLPFIEKNGESTGENERTGENEKAGESDSADKAAAENGTEAM